MAVFTIGSHTLTTPVVLAPMAGITDRPFRTLCLRYGAAMAASEMVTSDANLWHTKKSQLRLEHLADNEPRVVQIAGADPEQMANAAKLNQQLGAQIIDINMGCPAKKVCNKAAGSALMREPALVKAILQAVVAAVDIPVSLKIRTGWDREHKNGLAIAQIAQECGIASLAVHGRTREDKYLGEAEYDTIAQIVEAMQIPVIANGDITSPQKAKQVLDHTNAQAVMIGRGAQGRPWIFREIIHYLEHGTLLAPPSLEEQHSTVQEHLVALSQFYGALYDEVHAVRIARKHVRWYLQDQPGGKTICQQFNTLDTLSLQQDCITNYYEQLALQAVRDNNNEEVI